jgi:hypothetical protein
MNRATAFCAMVTAARIPVMEHWAECKTGWAWNCPPEQLLNLTRIQMQKETKQSAAMVFKHFFCAFVACIATAATGQTASDVIESIDEILPPPPSYSKDKLIPIEMPPYVTLKVGVDPETIAIAADGVLRYVVVMRNAAGSATAAYEGIHCAKGEVKTYARVNSDGAWVFVTQPQWRSLANNSGARHAQAIATQGGCEGVNSGRREDVIKALNGTRKIYY